MSSYYADEDGITVVRRRSKRRRISEQEEDEMYYGDGEIHKKSLDQVHYAHGDGEMGGACIARSDWDGRPAPQIYSISRVAKAPERARSGPEPGSESGKVCAELDFAIGSDNDDGGRSSDETDCLVTAEQADDNRDAESIVINPRTASKWRSNIGYPPTVGQTPPNLVQDMDFTGRTIGAYTEFDSEECNFMLSISLCGKGCGWYKGTDMDNRFKTCLVEMANIVRSRISNEGGAWRLRSQDDVKLDFGCAWGSSELALRILTNQLITMAWADLTQKFGWVADSVYLDALLLRVVGYRSRNNRV